MAFKLENDYRIESILSTLEILDGEKGKGKSKMRQSKSLRKATFASSLKSRNSLSGAKETQMVPKERPRESDQKTAGKYSKFLAHIVMDSSSNERRHCQKASKGDAIPNGVHSTSRGNGGQTNLQMKRNKFISADDHLLISKNTRHCRDTSVVQEEDRLTVPPLDRKQYQESSIRTEIESKNEQKTEQTNSAEAENTTTSGISKWQHIVNSRIKLKPIGDTAPAPGLGDVAKTKLKARQNRKTSSDSDKDEETSGLRHHISALNVINATIAFKRQRLQRLRKNRQFRISRLFKVVARLVVVVRRICAVHFVEKGAEEDEISFANLVSTRQRSDLMFDVTEYKAKKKWQLMSETKRILRKYIRNDQDIQHIETTLREMSALGEYPVSMQRSIARVGWYESYGPNRVLVREGHTPQAFYFILSGSALVSVSVPGESKPKILAILLRGDSFGELAILNQSKRTSTVTSRETVEMFVISAEDFIKIVMSGNCKRLQDPGTVSFMRSIEFLKEWPLHKIENHPKKCVFNFFRKDSVLVRDSKMSEWIYVVKSGSCSVLKQLKYIAPELYPTKQRPKKDERVTSSRHGQLLLDRERSFMNRRKIAARVQRESLYKRGMDLPYLMMNEELTERLAPPTRNRSNTTRASEDGTENIEEEKREERWMEELEEGGALNDMKETLDPLIEVHDEDEDDDSPRYGPQRTFAHDLNQHALRRKESTKLSSAVSSDGRPVFVCIQTLQKGGVFGLVDVLFSEQPSLSLISNGAECMVMSKHFFLQHATDDMLHRVKISMMPFAKEDEIQRSLENQLRWEAYRNVTMETTLSRMQMKKLYTK